MQATQMRDSYDQHQQGQTYSPNQAYGFNHPGNPTIVTQTRVSVPHGAMRSSGQQQYASPGQY
jgi:hypothetical protein